MTDHPRAGMVLLLEPGASESARWMNVAAALAAADCQLVGIRGRETGGIRGGRGLPSQGLENDDG